MHIQYLWVLNWAKPLKVDYAAHNYKHTNVSHDKNIMIPNLKKRDFDSIVQVKLDLSEDN